MNVTERVARQMFDEGVGVCLVYINCIIRSNYTSPDSGVCLFSEQQSLVSEIYGKFINLRARDLNGAMRNGNKIFHLIASHILSFLLLIHYFFPLHSI